MILANVFLLGITQFMIIARLINDSTHHEIDIHDDEICASRLINHVIRSPANVTLVLRGQHQFASECCRCIPSGLL